MLSQLAKYLQLLAHSVLLAQLPALYVVRGDTVDSDPELQNGRSRVRFPSVLLEMFINLILAVALYVPAIDSVSNGNEYHEYFLGVKAAVIKG